MKDITSEFQHCLTSTHGKAYELLHILETHFERETISAVVGELSEKVIETITGASRTDRNTKGHDIIDKNNNKIEVKSRIIKNGDDTRQFNFGIHSDNAHEAYCVAWNKQDNTPITVYRVFQIPMDELRNLGMMKKTTPDKESPSNKRYCVRTTLRRIMTELNKAS